MAKVHVTATLNGNAVEFLCETRQTLLEILRDAGVLQSRKEGKEVYFWINKAFLVDAMGTVVDYIRDHA